MIRFASILALLLPVAAWSQSVEDAARANAALALQLCIQPHVQPAARAQMFRNAGFGERVERSSMNSDTTHYFAAPADTVRVELYYGEMPEHCIVSSNHLGVTGAAAVLDSVVPRLYPGFVRQVVQGAPNSATGQPVQCVIYQDPANPIGLEIGVNAAGGAQGCVENGTSLFYQTYRV
ncbi:hypothetical protein [Pukyongiella litopenaei]|uniref:Type 4 secretion system PilS N-terminal domain-containing protein n=1 Tax=Pukyongiella litopenaei TaxID=2605946 RepID=A0A2S0MNL5_9RHOB|nr:hypothetical protein [Pukyongiella litopenaei]AVO37427.1 hypothetical protein C6Y53_06675 [Pukyongiella litopenaei]